MKRVEVSVIIVRYQATDKLIACIDAIYNTTKKTKFEIIVVDNNEKDSIEKMLNNKYHNVLYVKNSANTGYGAGINRGVQHAHGTYVFFLNNDMLLKRGCLDNLVSFIRSHPKAAAVSPQHLDTQGNLIENVGSKIVTPAKSLVVFSFLNTLFPNNPVSKRHYYRDAQNSAVKEVDIVSGGSMLIKKGLFESIGGFDENFFMYFEEFDLFYRIKREYTLNSYVIPDAQITHERGGDSKGKDIHKIFIQSRMYYFKKHFGVLWSLIVELFARFGKYELIVLLILGLAAFIRLYRIEENFNYFGEVGHNLLALVDAVEKKYIPLIGPPTSHPWLYFGPLYYWLYAPVLFLWKFNPLSYAYVGAFFSLAVVLVNYWVMRALFSVRVALISSFLIAISPLFMFFSWSARFFSFVPLFSLLFLFVTYQIVSQKRKMYVLAGILLGVMFSFHYTPIILIPFFITCHLWYRVKASIKNIAEFVVGSIIPLIPLIIFDMGHNAGMMKNLFLWIPYRIAGFLGIIPKNTVTEKVAQESTSNIWEFFRWSFLPQTEHILSSVLGAIVCGYALYILFKAVRSRQFATKHIIVITMLFWGVIALFIHGRPPIHYFVPILFVPILLLSLCVDSLLSKKSTVVLGTLLLLSIFFINIRMYVSYEWLNRAQVGDIVPYNTQLLAMRYIIQDAQGKQFEFHRVGPDDQFEGEFAQNYVYLLWLLGNRPVKSSNIVYTVYEKDFANAKQKQFHHQFGKIVVTKELTQH